MALKRDSVLQLSILQWLTILASTLFAGTSGLDRAKTLVTEYKTGKIERMSPELWQAKKIVDSTLHPGEMKHSRVRFAEERLTATRQTRASPSSCPFRMSCFVITNLIVTAGMLQPGLQTGGIVAWQIANQSLNVAINSANANKSSPMSTATLAKSYAVAVSASCSVALGLNSLVPRLRVSGRPRGAYSSAWCHSLRSPRPAL